MKDDFENVYDLIEHAIEYAFEGRMQLKFYEFLKYRKTTKAEIDAFLHSSTAKELADEVVELREYIRGCRIVNINNCVRHIITFLNLRQERL